MNIHYDGHDYTFDLEEITVSEATTIKVSPDLHYLA